jgi:hypothetical protein
MTFCNIVGHASRQTARGIGPSIIERSYFLACLGVDVAAADALAGCEGVADMGYENRERALKKQRRPDVGIHPRNDPSSRSRLCVIVCRTG